MIGMLATILGLPFLLAWLLGRSQPQDSTLAEPRCRCQYGDPCWPTEEAFTELASQLSVPLLRPRPLALPCYADADADTCVEIHARWDEGIWRAEQPGATQHPNFETFITPTGEVDACYTNSSISEVCGQGSVPIIGVEARTIGDVQAAVKFAAEYDLKLVIKNTGYDCNVL